jgi:hypothetical protein
MYLCFISMYLCFMYLCFISKYLCFISMYLCHLYVSMFHLYVSMSSLCIYVSSLCIYVSSLCIYVISMYLCFIRSFQSTLAESHHDRQELTQRVVALTERLHTLAQQANHDADTCRFLEKQVCMRSSSSVCVYHVLYMYVSVCLNTHI